MKKLVALLCAASTSVMAMTNPVYVKRSPCYASNGFLQGVWGVGNLKDGDLATVMGAQLNSPLMDGVLIKVQWSTVEPTNGGYNWASLDTAIQEVKAAGKKYILAVYGTGLLADSPAWLATAGVPYLATLDYKGNSNCGLSMQLYLPWDSGYQGFYTGLTNSIAARYGSDLSLAAVNIHGFNYDTDEAGFTTQNSGQMITCNGNPITVPDLNAQWQSVSYTATKADTAFKFMVAAYKTAFPTKQLIYSFLANGMPALDTSGNVNAAYTSYGTTDFIPAGEAISSLFGPQYNGYKLNASNGSDELLGETAVSAAIAAGWPGGFQMGNVISQNSFDFPGGAQQSPVCQMNGGPGKTIPSGTCLGWQVLKGLQNNALQVGVQYIQYVGTQDIVTWNPTVTNPEHYAYKARCTQQ